VTGPKSRSPKSRWAFLLCVVAAATVAAVSFQAADLPAFPGAEGYGSRTPGGRGGKVLFVTNLNDSGPGSLRAACEASGPRIVVFRVGGLIDLKRTIRISEPYVTVAGQTAPGDGICLRGYTFYVETHDVVVRFMRSRAGDITGKEMDAMGIGNGARNVIFDHCSASWGTDETLSPSGDIADVTIEWCLIAEGLNHSVHHKGPHGYGSLVRAAGGLSLHHNLWAHNMGRNPRLGDNYNRPPFPVFDVRNNVIYDAGGASIAGDFLRANYVANYYKPGPSTRLKAGIVSLTERSETRFYADGNVIADHPEMTRTPAGLFSRTEINGRKLVVFVEAPFQAPEVRTSRAEEAFRRVLEAVGATVPVRDAVDQRIIADARRGTGHSIDSQKEVGGWPEYRSGTPPLDSDNDGMPDDWEKAHGLDPHDPSDAAKDRDGDGYTNIEEYVNSLAGFRPRASGFRLQAKH
jgi:hypothetical protein